mmetsp:Transcript_11903/g.21538  ORF Transcript_11903/g.21538 Transcript_11903/m.21538 type:complete len:137 (+) Transcript_11903:97-507(+)
MSRLFQGCIGDIIRGAGGYARQKMPFLHSKFGNKKYYKGKGARRLGRHLPTSRYQMDQQLMPEYIVPDLTNFELKPYVDYRTPKIKVMPPPIAEVKEPRKYELYHVNKLRADRGWMRRHPKEREITFLPPKTTFKY